MCRAPLQAGVALTCSRVRVAGSPRRARAPGAAGMTHGLAEEAVTQSWIPAAPHPPAALAIAATWSPRDLRPAQRDASGGAEGPRGAARSRAGGTCPFPGPWGPRGPWEPVPSGVQEEDAPGSGWHRARPSSRPSWAWGSGSGTFPGCLGRLRLCHPRPAVPGAAPSSSPGGGWSSLHGGPGLLHLPWVCRGFGLRLQLHLPLALSHRWHRAPQLLWLSAQCWARVWGATGSCRKHCGPGQGQVAAEGGD